MKLSERTKVIKPSVTLAVAAKAQKLKAAGVDIVNFSAGEPDFDTPKRIKEAAVAALNKGLTKYTDVRGIEPLRAAIVEKYRREYGLGYDPDGVMVSCGGKHALYNVFAAVIDEGDEVVIPAPYWVSYADMVRLANGTPRVIPTRQENGFRLTADELARALTQRTRAFVLNSPSNPTGAAYGEEELLALSRVLERHDCLIVSDDIYEKIVYDGFKFCSVAALNPALRERTLIFNSLSKTYAMTGWRIGYVLGPPPVIAAAAKIQSQSTSNPTSIAQWAALEAVQGPQDDVTRMVREFERRRNATLDGLAKVPGMSCFKPQGAFYVFPNIRAFLGKKAGGKEITSPCDLADFLLEEARVALVPGEDFGSAENIRLSYATSLEDVERGCERIRAALDRLQ
jgi:aspartate aminotransferase